MTNEKAIDLLRRMQEPEAYEPQITEEAFEALEMAIRALGTDTNVGDMISRQAAIDALHMDTSIIPFEKAREYADATISEIRNRLEKLPSAQPETNCSEFPNNSDTISRQAAIDELDKGAWGVEWDKALAKAMIESLPSAHPEIIRCRECKFASGDSRICMKFDHSPIGELDFCSFAERREVTT